MAARLNMNIFNFSIFILSILLCTTAYWVEGWTHSKYDFTTSVKISPLKDAVDLDPGVKYIKESNDSTLFYVFCFQNVPKSFLQIWRSVQLILLDIPVSYNVFHGVNKTEVLDNYQSKSSWSPTLIFSTSDTVVDFPAFSDYCAGVASKEAYSLFLQVRTINYWKVLQTLLGVFLYLSSPDLSRNSFFHYAAGVTFGVFASVLILLYVLSRFIPQKIASGAVLVFGSSFLLYFLNRVWYHLHDIITQHMDIVLSYFVVTSFLSFVVCYRMGPVQSERTCNIIQWSMQALALLLIFFSSEYREMSTTVILLLVTLRLIPTRWIKWVKFLWYKCFPPKVKLLSELEYIEQGHIETKKALEDLRVYCNSPDCKVWKVVRRLKNPVRFANFIETGSHYTDEELLDYNSEDAVNNYRDDSDVELDGTTDY